MRRAVATILTVAAATGLIEAVRRRWGPDSRTFALIATWTPMVAVGTSSRWIHYKLPDRWHRLRPWERSGRVYEVLGVRAAKAALRRGPLAVFNPDLHLPAERTAAQLATLDERMREAEASHTMLLAATAVVALGSWHHGHRRAARWMLAGNLVMNGYPAMLQRYNRALLAQRFESLAPATPPNPAER
jgi:hypothetical protein